MHLHCIMFELPPIPGGATGLYIARFGVAAFKSALSILPIKNWWERGLRQVSTAVLTTLLSIESNNHSESTIIKKVTDGILKANVGPEVKADASSEATPLPLEAHTGSCIPSR